MRNCNLSVGSVVVAADACFHRRVLRGSFFFYGKARVFPSDAMPTNLVDSPEPFVCFCCAAWRENVLPHVSHGTRGFTTIETFLFLSLSPPPPLIRAPHPPSRGAPIIWCVLTACFCANFANRCGKTNSPVQRTHRIAGRRTPRVCYLLFLHGLTFFFFFLGLWSSARMGYICNSTHANHLAVLVVFFFFSRPSCVVFVAWVCSGDLLVLPQRALVYIGKNVFRDERAVDRTGSLMRRVDILNCGML